MSKPKPTPPKETSAASTGTNVSTSIANAFLNNPNEITPDGTKTVTQTGSYQWTDPYTNQTYNVPRFTTTQTLSPQQQAVKAQSDAANLSLAKTGANQAKFLEGYLGRPITANDLNATAPARVNSYDTEFTKDRQRTEEALFSRLNPQLEQDREALQTRLSNQGIKLGSTGFDRAMGQFGQQSNDARMAAILASGQEQSRLANLARDSATFQNQSRAGALDEAFALRNQPLNEISALMSGGQVSQPRFMTGYQGSNIPVTDNASIIGNYDQQNAARANMINSSIGSAIGGVGGLFAGGVKPWIFSDERLKEDVKKVGETDDGQKIYSYRMKGGGPIQIGLMAQQVEKKVPGAVKTHPSGYKMVDYGKALKRA